MNRTMQHSICHRSDRLRTYFSTLKQTYLFSGSGTHFLILFISLSFCMLRLFVFMT